jgi:chromate reductase
MVSSHDVAVLVGSLRRDSLSRKLVRAMSGLGESRLSLRIVEIGDLPLYDPDLDVDPVPAPWSRLRAEVTAADAVLFVTPEYNRSIPGALKNAIDVGSRPYGKAAWTGKPAAVASLSQGAMGGFGANHQLRQMLVFFDMPVLQQPEAYLGGAGQMFDAAGGFAAPATADYLGKFLAAFADWIDRTGRRS